VNLDTPTNPATTSPTSPPTHEWQSIPWVILSLSVSISLSVEKTKLPNTGGGQIQFIKWGKQLCEELKRTKFHTD